MENIVEKALELNNFNNLNPVQKIAVDNGLLQEKNMIVATPTASGKTLIASILGLQAFYQNKKMLYLCPLVALAREKYQSFKQTFSSLGIKVALSIGDLDSSDPWLQNYDWIICSNEKADSLIRHGARWIRDIGVIVADEIHLLTDSTRGPTLEILLTRLREMLPQARILGLSATISNADEIGEWLNSVVVKSDWRPVELHEGISYNSSIVFFDKDSYEINDILSPEAAIFDNTLDLGKQALFFVSSRRNAEALAERLANISNSRLKQEERARLSEISDKALKTLEIPTTQCKRLSECLKKGVAFHHAGLLEKQKMLIEDEFRNGIIKTIAATPTLAAGVNLPAFRAVIRDAKRYYPGYGSRYIPVLEYKQMVGRAGRPDYDKFGESVLLAKTENEAEDLVSHFIKAEPEEVESKLSLEPVLRMQTLAMIASNFTNTEKALLKFFEKTFYAKQYGDISDIRRKIKRIINMHIEFKLLERDDDKLTATRLGRRISELYIDPLTGNHFVECLKKAEKGNVFGLIHTACNTLEMGAATSLRKSDFEMIESALLRNKENFLTKIPEEWEYEYDNFVKSIKLANIFQEWINEKTEEDILNVYNTTPGELNANRRNMEWLLYAANEIAVLEGHKRILNDLNKIRVRMKYGVKEDLLPLVRLRGIGRIRARRLYSRGLKSLSDLRKAQIESIEKVVGSKTALSIKQQLGEKDEGVVQKRLGSQINGEGKKADYP